jgi:hypothetical protein
MCANICACVRGENACMWVEHAAGHSCHCAPKKSQCPLHPLAVRWGGLVFKVQRAVPQAHRGGEAQRGEKREERGRSPPKAQQTRPLGEGARAETQTNQRGNREPNVIGTMPAGGRPSFIYSKKKRRARLGGCGRRGGGAARRLGCGRQQSLPFNETQHGPAGGAPAPGNNMKSHRCNLYDVPK